MVRFLAVSGLLLSVVACGGTSGGAAAPVLTTITVSLSATSLTVGQTATASAAGRDQNGAAIAIGDVTWSSQSSSASSAIATVSGTGVVGATATVTAVAAGTAKINAVAGGKSASATLIVTAVDALAACRLPAGFSNGVGLGFPRVANRLRSTGDVRITAIFVDFSDAVATRTPQSVLDILSPGAPDFYKAMSYGKMNLTVAAPNLAWLRMSKPSTGYGWSGLTFANHKAYIQEAINLAGTSADFSTSDAFLVVGNPDATALSNGPAFTANPGDGVTASGKSFENGATSGHDLLVFNNFWLNHEFGHTMSLVDLYEIGQPNPATFHFTGDFSIMGNINGAGREYLAWERWTLGWLTDDQVACAPSAQSATLTPVEQAGGLKMVVAPTGATTAVVVESRRALGYDTGLTKPGLLVYSIDTSVNTGAGVIKVFPVNDADVKKLSAPLAAGESVTAGAVTVTFTSQDAAGDHVQIAR